MAVDLAQCSLAEMAELGDDELADVLGRAVPPPAGSVPVAAFNSSIG